MADLKKNKIRVYIIEKEQLDRFYGEFRHLKLMARISTFKDYCKKKQNVSRLPQKRFIKKKLRVSGSSSVCIKFILSFLRQVKLKYNGICKQINNSSIIRFYRKRIILHQHTFLIIIIFYLKYVYLFLINKYEG